MSRLSYLQISTLVCKLKQLFARCKLIALVGLYITVSLSPSLNYFYSLGSTILDKCLANAG